jgi:hypothetical protein
MLFLLTGNCLLIFPQRGRQTTDTLQVVKDTIAKDTILGKESISKDAIDKTITYNARGYRRSVLKTKTVYLVDAGVVTYGDITLKADSIVLNMETSTVFAIGRRDSTGKVTGKPVFIQGSETFESEELTYNFRTGKARVLNMVTQQEEGYLHSGVTKKLNDGSFNISKSTYSTCDAPTPHFYIGFRRARVVPGKKIITGPAYMVIEDIPLPIVIPFGYFPIQTKNAESGIIIPKLGQTSELGYSLREGGYYFAISDNFDLAITGNIYTNGTWMTNLTSSYIKKYKYSGRASLSFANNVTGHKGLPDYSVSKNYRIDWTYNQDAKNHPGSRFAANVSMSSSNFDQQNSYVPASHVNAQSQSSVSYSKNWDGTPFNFSTSLNHSQNIRNKTMFLNLPKANFTMQRIYPLKNRNKPGPARWYQDLQFQYTAMVDNQINAKQDELFTPNGLQDMKNGFKHDAPLSIQLRPFKKISGFSISPQLMYSGVLYTQKYEKYWVPDFYDASINDINPTVVTDTLKGLFYGQAVNASISAGLSPQIFGTYMFTNPNSRYQAIRHVIRPSIGFSYVPVLEGLSSDMWKEVQVDTSGRMQEYSIFEGNIYGTPSLSGRSGGITFSLVNILEAKVFEKNDTTGKPKKVKIIDNLTMNTSYNIFADSLRWAPLNMSYRTVLLENFNIAANGVFSFYSYDKAGRTINEFYISQTNKLLRLTGLNLSLDFDLARLLQKKKKAASVNTSQNLPPNNQQEDGMMAPPSPVQNNLPLQTPERYGYAQFNMPWSLRMAYNIYYTKPADVSTITQTLQMGGSVSLTKKTNINYTTGVDIARKQITMTSIGISRDLHCWIINFDWIPIGYMKSWQFTIRPKASIFADLKYERRKDYHDNF